MAKYYKETAKKKIPYETHDDDPNAHPAMMGKMTTTPAKKIKTYEKPPADQMPKDKNDPGYIAGYNLPRQKGKREFVMPKKQARKM